MALTPLARNTDQTFISISALQPPTTPEIYTFDSRSEAVCAIILEQYIPDWKVKRGSTWQIPLPYGKLADFRVYNTVIEFHPIELYREFKDALAYSQFTSALLTISPDKSEEFEKSIKIEKYYEYKSKRKELVDSSEDLYFCDLEVCSNEEAFAETVSSLVGYRIDSGEILREWKYYFQNL